MSADWSHIKTAINHGWGLPMSRRHPEYSFKGPYGAYALATDLPMYNHASPVGGARIKRKSRLVKGSKEAKAYMAKLRAMRGHGYTSAALEGCGYNNAALEGTGMSWNDVGDMFTGVGENLNQQAMTAVSQLANRANVSVTELLQDPDKLVALAKQYFPTAKKFAQKIIGLFRRKSTKKKQQKEQQQRREELGRYMKQLKEFNPDQYRNMYKRMRENAWKKYQDQHRALFDIPDETQTDETD